MRTERRILRTELFVTVAICIGLIGAVWFVFGQSIHFPFINFDDPEYVYEVPEINSGLSLHNLKWAFTHWPSPNWFPLKNISHMIEFQFYGSRPGLFHLTNVVLHTITAVLLFFVLLRMTRDNGRGNSFWSSAFAAAVFAIHPLRAESVVWIEERKDVLSGVFFMLTLAAYLRYVSKPSIGRYVVIAIMLVCGLLSKPMLVTAPVILLLLDYWPLRRLQAAEGEPHLSPWLRIRGLIVEKIPLLVLAAVLALLSSHGIAGTHSEADQLPVLARLGNAIVSYVVYIWELIWPANLGVFYPFPINGLPIWQPIGSLALLLGITFGLWSLRRSRPYLLVGWLWYVVMLLPVIGLIQINLQAHADRYTYLPSIGLYVAISWLVPDLFCAPKVRTREVQAKGPSEKLHMRPLALGLCSCSVLVALAITARQQVDYWRDSETLWRHTITVTRDNYFAHSSLADFLMRQGRVTEAIEHSEEALRIRPADADAQNNLGLAMLQTGDLKRGVTHLEKALEIDPAHLNAEVNLAWVLATAPDASMRDGTKAVELTEDVARRSGHPNAIVLRTLAAAYAETGQFSNAIQIAEQAREIASATGQTGLATDLDRNIETYRAKQPLRSRLQ
jgi:tetratricopeptide (TPR) repeat protein